MSTMDEPPLSEFEVIRFLENRGGRCTNYELVSNFRGILNNPTHQAEARLKFKDIINRVAAVVEYQNIKYIELRKEYDSSPTKQGQNYDQASLPFDPNATSGYTSPLTQNFQPYWRYRLSTNPHAPRKSEHASSKSLNRSISESTLPDDRLHPPRTPTLPLYSNRELPQNVCGRYSLSVDEKAHLGHLPTENLAREPNIKSNAPSAAAFGRLSTPNSLESGGRSSSLSRDESFSSWSSGGHYLNDTQYGSSGYCSSTESVRNSLTSLRTDPSSIHNWSKEESRPCQERSFELPLNSRSKDDTVTSISPPSFKLSNEPVYSGFARQYGGVFHEDKYSPNAEKNPNMKGSRGPLKIIQTDHRYQHTTLETNKSINWPTSDHEVGEDIFSDPNYLRSVSKLCFSKNKTSFGVLNHSPEKSDNCHEFRNTTVVPVKDRSSLGNIKKPPTMAREDDRIPPPERRCLDGDSSPATAEETEEKLAVTIKDEKISSGKVKDKVQHFDEMEKRQQKRSSTQCGGKENRALPERTSLDDDISISVLDPKLKKEWFVKSSQCDYHSLLSLLKKEPKLAALKDVTSGYTALHWAAKHGDANVVKLIAGSYKINPNIRSNGGYTPLHLSSLYKHHMIGHLLIHTYGADPSIRDYYGKKADQYPDNYIRKVAGSKNIERRPVKQRPTKQTSSNSFMRIGSLNLRKARKSTVFASVRGNNRNHSELRFGNVDSVRKRTSKKENLYSERNCILEDTSYGFPLKKQDI